MKAEEYLDVLDQRRRYLEARVQAKRSVGWDYAYDQRERDALTWAVTVLSPATNTPAAESESGCQHPEEKRVPSHNIGEAPEFMCLDCLQAVKVSRS